MVRIARVGFCEIAQEDNYGKQSSDILNSSHDYGSWLWSSGLYAVSFSLSFVCVHAQLLQSCPTLWDPRDCSPPGSSVHGFLQAVEWLPCPPPGDLPNPGLKPVSPASPALAGRFFTTESPSKPSYNMISYKFYYLKRSISSTHIEG